MGISQLDYSISSLPDSNKQYSLIAYTEIANPSERIKSQITSTTSSITTQSDKSIQNTSAQQADVKSLTNFDKNNNKQERTLQNKPPWYKYAFRLVGISLFFALALLLSTGYSVFANILFFVFLSGFMLLLIKPNGYLRKFATILSLLLLQVDGVLYMWGYFAWLTFSGWPLIITLLSLLAASILIIYVILKAYLQKENYDKLEDKQTSNRRARKSIRLLGILLLSAAFVFALVLLIYMNPFYFGFIPHRIGFAIVLNAVMGIIMILFSYFFSKKFVNKNA